MHPNLAPEHRFTQNARCATRGRVKSLVSKGGFRALGRFLVLGFLFVGCGSVFGLVITDPGQGLFALSSGSTGAAELSGLTYAGGTTYYAVGDNGAKSIWTLAVTINSANGFITAGSVNGSISAPALGSDSEGIAFRSGTNSVFVSDEVTSTIKEFSVASGAQIGSVAVPTIYNNLQGNFGLESLSLGGGHLWTANEEALTNDGALSTTSSGSWVRLQRFNSLMETAGQWAYQTDAISGTPIFGAANIRSGVSDVLALPTGGLLVLERELGGSGFIPDFRSRLYEVDFAGSDDVSAVSNLSLGGFTAASKSLLWEGNFASTNFEGITLGPLLDNGQQSVLLVSDDGSGSNGQTQSLYSLALNIPEPSSSILLLFSLGIYAIFQRRRTV